MKLLGYTHFRRVTGTSILQKSALESIQPYLEVRFQEQYDVCLEAEYGT
jgi:hypothetical protein